MLVTPAYAAVFGILFSILSVRTLRLRGRLRIPLGHGDNPLLLKAVRAHSNFAEYVPITLLLIFFVEMQTSSALWAHGLCSALLLGRMIHAFGVSQEKEDFRLRVTGMALTFTPLLTAAVRLLVLYLP